MGRLYESVEAATESNRESTLPSWLQTALRDQLNLAPEEIFNLTEQQGQELLMEHWSNQRKE
ncbi:hypothetical protein [Arthrobacter sp. lap29]|uniref:hypothetical protein n=1 Tax=Arthrobacter sp. lap29 TaxID=3056122 RepID=UPI0028F6FE3B|nr:hypothetical protein [Arthrobacter sp. lap29]